MKDIDLKEKVRSTLMFMTINFQISYSFRFCSTNDAVLEEMKREYTLQQEAKGSAGVL